MGVGRRCRIVAGTIELDSVEPTSGIGTDTREQLGGAMAYQHQTEPTEGSEAFVHQVDATPEPQPEPKPKRSKKAADDDS